MEQITVLDPAILDEITEAFLDYEYQEGEDSQFYLFKDRKHIQIYLKTFLEQGLKNGLFYTYHNQGYVMLSSSEDTCSLLDSLILLYRLIRGMGFFGVIEYTSAHTKVKPSLEVRLKKKNRPFYHIEMLVVLPQYQHQGIMRSMLEDLKAMAKRDGRKLILETDCQSKSQRYTHLGMKLVSTRQVTKSLAWYDFIC